MSPTSYQAAPHRTSTIAELPPSVKFHDMFPIWRRFALRLCSLEALHATPLDAPACGKMPGLKSGHYKEILPGGIGGPVQGVLLAAGMHVVHARAGLVRAQNGIADVHHPIILVADRVERYFAQVMCLHQIVQRLRRLLLVQRIIVDGLPHGLQVLFQHGLARSLHGLVVNNRGHADQDREDHHHDHQLDQRESQRAATPAVRKPRLAPQFPRPLHSFTPAFTFYQSEYLVPSSAIPVDFEYTSKTLFPPQLVESGSSCTERKPHSARPVIGSTGTRRKNRMFFRPRRCRPAPRPLPACPNPEGSPRCPLPRESSADPPSPCTCRSRCASRAGRSAIPFRVRGSP